MFSNMFSTPAEGESNPNSSQIRASENTRTTAQSQSRTNQSQSQLNQSQQKLSNTGTGSQQQDGDNAEQTEDDDENMGGWIPWFCAVPGHEFFVEVDDDYVRDNFNLYGLRNRVQYYEHALEMILMPEAPDEEDLQDADFLEVYRDAQDLYGLIHARFIISPRGLEVMREQYMSGVFGCCPRVCCGGQVVIPVGHSDELRVSRVKTYCPRCEQLYATKSKYCDVDGAYFGTSFPHIFAMTFPSLVPQQAAEPYVPRIFGFKMSQPPGIITKTHQAKLAAVRHREAIQNQKAQHEAKIGAIEYTNNSENEKGDGEEANESPVINKSASISESKSQSEQVTLAVGGTQKASFNQSPEDSPIADASMEQREMEEDEDDEVQQEKPGGSVAAQCNSAPAVAVS